MAVVTLALLWAGSDYANTSLRTATSDSTQPPDADPPAAVGALWSNRTGPSAPDPVQDGVVVVGDEHGLQGLDVDSGAQRWQYSRVTARLCDWVAEDGVVVAVFGSGDGCDEAVALDAGTGQRVWYRNVSYRNDVVLTSTDQLTLISTSTGVTALGTTYNGTRWRYAPPSDCVIADSQPGDVGAAILLDCGGTYRLELLNGFTGEQRWTGSLPPGPARLATADGVVAVLGTDLTGALQVFDREGLLLASLQDPALVGAAGADPSALLLGSRLALFTGSALVGIDTADNRVLWVARATTSGVLLDAGLLVYDGSGFVQLDLRTGLPLRTITVDGPAPEPGSALHRIGPRIVVNAPGSVTVYG